MKILTRILASGLIVSTRVRRASNPREIDRLLLPEGLTFDENIFSHGGKIEYPRKDLTFLSNECYRGFNMNETCHQAKLAKVADSAKIIDFLSL